ncbi:MAG: iron-sulfur cluster repair di-iron protein [Burkholderiales bacterium]|jgi:regulator of cell morphogenesis and NO signaling|nr:iron-sulfur cluster repair di-iron protein [Burkholderiales bacterium]
MAFNMTVGEMAAKEPKSTALFKEIGIDFCCNGKDDLAEALRRKKVSPEQFAERLATLKAESENAGNHAGEINFLDMKPAALAEHIVTRHHEYLRKSLPETLALFLKVLRVHGAQHPELYEAFKSFGAMKTDLEQHLIKEETLLFPEFANRSGRKIASLMESIESEHESVGRLLDNIRAISRDYVLPPDACMSYANLYRTLQEIEDDIHQHIHLENNILFKRLA